MKDGIHPKYGPASIHCACGNVIETRSTIQGVIQVEICSACHPFFTGKQKLIDTAGRIDRFKKKFGEKISIGNLKKSPKPAAHLPVKAAKETKPAAGSGPKGAMQEKFQAAKDKAASKTKS